LARGAFDPTLVGDWAVKDYADKLYYNKTSAALKLPTWYGPEFSLGFERGIGDFVSGESQTSLAGLVYGGISLPIGQELIVNERRTALQLAQLMPQMNAAEQVKTINKLLLMAAKDYWSWYQAWEAYQLATEGIALAEFTLRGVRAQVEGGDLPAIDTLEARIELQRRQTTWLESGLALQNFRLLISNYLWLDGNTPLELDSLQIPGEAGAETLLLGPNQLNSLRAEAQANHPELLKLRLKVQGLELERTLYRTQILPQVRLEYKPLFVPAGQPDLSFNYLQNNYKYGASVYVPLFARKARGKLELTRLKLQATEWELLQTERDVLTGLEFALNELATLEQTLQLQRELTQNTLSLLEAERIRFFEGESSLFVIVRRERALLEASLKLIDLQAKYAKAKVQVFWAAGIPLGADRTE
jgi:outer membrane protein TolC